MRTFCQLCSLEFEINDSPFMEAMNTYGKSPVARAAMESVMKLAPQVVHDACIEAHNAQMVNAGKRTVHHRLEVRWNKACPTEFKKTDYHQIRFKKKKEVLDAFKSGSSVLMQGDTGLGKTRLVWMMIRAPFMAQKKVEMRTHIGLANAMRAESMKGVQWSNLLLSKLRDCDVLVIDDLGKARMVGADGAGLQNEEQMFEVIDYRLSWNKQMVFTTQDSRETLEARMSHDRARAMIRRILDACLLFES